MSVRNTFALIAFAAAILWDFAVIWDFGELCTYNLWWALVNKGHGHTAALPRHGFRERKIFFF